MINKNIKLYNNVLIYEKFNNIYLRNTYIINLKKLNISLIIPSDIKNSYGFITMLLLLEKNINNIPVFLLDRNTLSRNRVIKIGLTITIYDEILNYYLQICMEYSTPRVIENNIVFNIPLKNINYFYNISKMLSNTVFSFDNQMYLYYIFLSNLPYAIEFIFYTTSRNKLINKLLMSNNTIGITSENDNTIDVSLVHAGIIALQAENTNGEIVNMSDDDDIFDMSDSDITNCDYDSNYDSDYDSDSYYHNNTYYGSNSNNDNTEKNQSIGVKNNNVTGIDE